MISKNVRSQGLNEPVEPYPVDELPNDALWKPSPQAQNGARHGLQIAGNGGDGRMDKSTSFDIIVISHYCIIVIIIIISHYHYH